jgi:LacI family transcriptional regulator
MKENRKVTVKEIAQACGVSLGTVDRAFHGRSGISASTRQQILETAERLGYRPHLLAQRLKKGKSMTVGIVVIDLYNRFFSQLVDAMEKEARENGYFSYLTLTDYQPEEEWKCLDRLASMQVDGILLFPINRGEQFESHLATLGRPIVSVGNMISSNWHHVGIDDRKAIEDAMLYLLRKGYERIAYVTPDLKSRKGQNAFEITERLEAYKTFVNKELKAQNPLILDRGNYVRSVQAMLREGARKTGLLCYNDIYALEAIKTLSELGVRVPEDIGIMGFDNIDTVEYTSPRLSTVAYPIVEMGKTAFHTLKTLMEGNSDAGSYRFTCQVVDGEST